MEFEILSNGTTYVVIIDDDDYAKISKYRWSVSIDYNKLYARSNIVFKGKRTRIMMHRLIIGECTGHMIDHINGNGLDNRKCNLRICTNSQNQANRGKQKNNTTGYKGVSLIKKTGKYGGQIKVNKKLHQLGYFETAIEAAKAYNKAAIKYFGDFAYLNKVG